LLELGAPSTTPPPGVYEAAAKELSGCVDRLHVDATCKVLDRPAVAAIVREAEAIGAELIVLPRTSDEGFGRRSDPAL
jgi:hypothetical protein